MNKGMQRQCLYLNCAGVQQTSALHGTDGDSEDDRK